MGACTYCSPPRSLLPPPGATPTRSAGAPIPQHCRIHQAAVHKGHGALPSRLHKQGQVLGRGVTRLTVQFDGEDTVVSIRPHLVRVLTTPGGY
jgi:hypothetical protein